MNNREKKIVVNTSPWIALSLCGEISLLNILYSEVYIPFAVKEEIMTGGEKSIGVRELRASSWVKIKKIIDAEKVRLLHELDQGEAEVIILFSLAFGFGFSWNAIVAECAKWSGAFKE